MVIVSMYSELVIYNMNAKIITKKKKFWVYTEVYIHKHKNVGFHKNTNVLL